MNAPTNKYYVNEKTLQVTVGKDNTTTIEKYDVKKERAARSPKSKTDVG